ncbi:MAG: hypothetical protein RBR54_01550 [Sulfurimonas sp.]|jgi:hypothetical protein|nr:hypothetical protein [Sulfurimonas sp.]
MKITSMQTPPPSFQENAKGIKPLYTEKLTADEAKELRQQVELNANAFTFNSVEIQSNLFKPQGDFEKEYQEFQSFLKDVGYEGKPIASLSQEEAGALVAEDGFFGIEQTSQRIADFVINGAGGNEDLLRAGREGVLKGFEEAQQAWGEEKLPDISQQTMKKAVEMIDRAMSDLGFSIINQEA